jgi:predicted metal-binding protein
LADSSINIIFVCKSCDHIKPVSVDRLSEGAMLTLAINAHLDTHASSAMTLQNVGCLGGCLKPCNVAFRGAERYSFRFSRLTAEDVGSLVQFGALYWSKHDGDVDIAEIPGSLAAKLTVHVPPRRRPE